MPCLMRQSRFKVTVVKSQWAATTSNAMHCILKACSMTHFYCLQKKVSRWSVPLSGKAAHHKRRETGYL